MGGLQRVDDESGGTSWIVEDLKFEDFGRRTRFGGWRGKPPQSWRRRAAGAEGRKDYNKRSGAFGKMGRGRGGKDLKHNNILFGNDNI